MTNSRAKGGAEEWRPVRGYESLYEVSNLGEIRRYGGKPLKGCIDAGGYRTVMLYDHCKHKHVKVHRAVAMAFIENPQEKRTVNHIDGNKLNNSVDNLEWATHSENHKHAYSIGLKKVSEKQRAAASKVGKATCGTNRLKKKVALIDENGDKTVFESAHAGARFVGGNPSMVVRVCKGKAKTHKGYRWEYAD